MRIQPSQETERTQALAVNPKNSHHWLRGTNRSLYRSEDAGETWQEAEMSYPAEDVVGISFAPRGRVYVAMREMGLLLSEDGGNVWQRLEIPVSPAEERIFLSAVSVSSREVFVRTTAGWLRSSNGGRNWSWMEKTSQRETRSDLLKWHTGYILGAGGQRLFEIASWGMIILSVSGLLIFRRRKNGGLPLVLLAVFLAQSSYAEYSQMRYVMGTLLKITVFDADSRRPAQAVEGAFERVRELDEKLSNYKPESEISRINREAPQSVLVSEDTRRCLSAAIRYADLSGGALDPTVEPLLRLWGIYDGKRRAPSDREIAKCLKRVGWRGVKIFASGRQVRLLFQGMGLDLGAIGKGYALDEAVKILKKQGIRSATLNFGGQILVLGSPPEGRLWKIGKKEDDGQPVLFLREGSVATSSQKENPGHILDPKTGRPANLVRQVTVVSKTALEADALSTACFVLGPEKGKALAESLGARAIFIKEE